MRNTLTSGVKANKWGKGGTKKVRKAKIENSR